MRIRNRWFSSSDQLVTMIMGGEIYLPGYEKAWKIGRDLGLPVAAHILVAVRHAAHFRPARRKAAQRHLRLRTTCSST